MLRFRDAFEERFVRLVRHDRCAFVDRRTNASKVVPVMMRGGHISNRLVRDRLLGLGQHGRGAVLVLRHVHDDDVVTHFDREAMV